MKSLASPHWQEIFFLLAGLYLLWEVWMGWRRGVVRSAVYYCSFIVAGVVGWTLGQAVFVSAGRGVPGGAWLAGVVVGITAMAVVFLLFLFLGAILFKRTAQQSSTILRVLFGAGGAVFGFLLGLSVLWGVISMVRLSGTLAESSMAGRPVSEAPAPFRCLATLKESLEYGSLGQQFERVDVVPPQTYRMMVQLGRLKNDHAALERLLDYPGMQDLLVNPKIQQLGKDLQSRQHASPIGIADLLGSESLRDVLNDPVLANKLKNFDLQKALDYAVPSADASPPPIPKKKSHD